MLLFMFSYSKFHIYNKSNIDSNSKEVQLDNISQDFIINDNV